MASKTKDRPRISGKQVAGVAAVVAGAAAIGAGLFFVKEKSTPRPWYDTIEEDGDFTIRKYPALLVAETTVTGTADRKRAQNEGFRTLANYIFAKSRDGEKIEMTAPVLCDRPVAGETTKDDVSGGWRMRFIMPEGSIRETLPEPPEGVSLVDLPARRVGAVAFSGLWSNANLEEEEAALRSWLLERGETEAGHVEFAFYDAPMIPGPLRRNEVLIALGDA